MTAAEMRIKLDASELAEEFAAIRQRQDDQDKAILALAGVVERLVVGDKKRWKGEESKAMLFEIDLARALATPEAADDGDDDPDPPALARYGIDTRSGDLIDTDDLDECYAQFAAHNAKNIYDRERRELLVYNGIWEDAASAPLEAAEAA